MFELNNAKNEAILRDFFNFQTWQHQKRSNSARLPSKMESCLHAALTASYLCVLRFFQSICLNYCACPRKSDARSYEVLHLSRKIISANLKIWGSKMQPLSGNHRPDLLTALMKMSLVLRLPRKMHLCRSSQMSHACHCFWKCYKTFTFCSLLTRSTIPCACHAKAHLNLQKLSEPLVFLTFWLGNVLRATTACTFSTSQLPKVVRSWCVLCILTSTCASRHNGVHFFDISTSKSGPELVCFVHFDFEMCFAPQQRVLFRHRNFQKWSDPGVFCKFWLRNVLRATTACTFSTSQLPKVVRTWCVLYILTLKCHNGVQFFISHLASWL